MITLDKSLTRIDKVNTFTNLLTEELNKFKHFKLDSSFTESILTTVTLFIKPKDQIVAADYALSVMASAWNLTDDEKQIIKAQIDTCIRSGRITKYPMTQRFIYRMYKFIWPFAKNVIDSQLKK
jgi:hypothetical protein